MRFGDEDLRVGGTVTMVAPEVDAATRLILAEISVVDGGALDQVRVGSVARVRLSPAQDE